MEAFYNDVTRMDDFFSSILLITIRSLKDSCLPVLNNPLLWIIHDQVFLKLKYSISFGGGTLRDKDE